MLRIGNSQFNSTGYKLIIQLNNTGSAYLYIFYFDFPLFLANLNYFNSWKWVYVLSVLLYSCRINTHIIRPVFLKNSAILPELIDLISLIPSKWFPSVTHLVLANVLWVYVLSIWANSHSQKLYVDLLSVLGFLRGGLREFSQSLCLAVSSLYQVNFGL